MADDKNNIAHWKRCGLTRAQVGFLVALVETGNISKACAASGITRNSHYKWMQSEDYKRAFADAMDDAVDALEAEAKRRAVDGLRRYKFSKAGKPLLHPETGEPYYEHEYSDTLLIFLLKGARPQKFRDNVDVTSGGQPITVKRVIVEGDDAAD